MGKHHLDHKHDHHCNEHHHDHSHDHHHHGPKNYNSIFFFGIILNFSFVIVEFLFGFFSNSLALMADAGHNLSDVAGLILAWGAFWLAKRKPSTRFTFGLRKSSILSALFNAILLLVAIGIIIWEAIHRFFIPTEVQSTTMIIVATIGIVINAGTAMLFMKDRDHDINIKGAYLHMMADALISLGVVLAGFAIKFTGYQWIDPVTTLIICAIIIVGTWGLLKDSIIMSMDAVPENIDPEKIRQYFEKLPGVEEVHDLHIWAMSTTENALTVHLVVKENINQNKLLKTINHELVDHQKIHHPTIQIEQFDNEFVCSFKADDVV